MSITSRINEMSSHIEQAYDELQGLGAGLTNVNKNIENISMVLDDIYDSMPQVSGEGTSLTLEDTRVGKIKSTLKGNTSQTTYSGKNLANTKITNWSYLGVSVSYDEVTQILTINGTSTGNASLSFGRYNFSPISVSSGERLNLVVKYVSGSATSNDNGRISLADENYILSMAIPLNGINTDKSEYKNVNSNLNYNILQFSYRNGDIYNNLKIKIMVCKGSDISYQPYVGGTASPNPEFPQPVNVVSGDNEINVVGKNLWTISKTQIGSNWHNTYVEDGETISVTATGTYAYRCYYIEDLIVGQQYTVSFDGIKDTNATYGRITAGAGTGTSDEYGYQTLTTTKVNYHITFTATSNVMHLAIYPVLSSYSSGGNITISNIQLEKGSSATTYEPYQGNTYNIDLGVENLWDTSKLQSGYLNQSGSYPTTNPSFPNARYRLVYLYKGQSITTYRSTIYGDFRMRYIDVDTNLIVGTVGVGDNGGYCSSNATYQGSFNNGTITALKDVILGLFDYGGNMAAATITYGTKIQAISPTPIELCKIGNYQDYFGKSDGRNLLDLTKAQTQSSNTPKVQDDKIVASSPIAWSSIYFTFTGLSKNTTYYIKSNLAFTSGGGAYSQIFGGSVIEQSKVIKTYMNNITTSGDYSTSFSTGDNDTITISFCASGNNGIWNLSNIILSSEDISYEPYGVGKWYLHKEIGKVVLNGSESWAKSSNTNINRYYIPGTFINTILNVSTIDLISDYFTCITPIQSDAYNVGLSKLNNTSIMANFSLSDTSFDTLEKFKTWLSSHNVVVYYVLATPTNTEVEYQPLIDQLNLLEKAMSKDGQTNISQVNNDLPFIISASALKEWSV